MACGFSHYLMLDIENQVWGSGRNDWGQLRLQDIFSVNYYENKFEKLPIDEKIYSIACAANHSLCITVDKGEIYSFGCNEDEQLGHNDTLTRKTPCKIDNLENVTDLYTCYGFSLFVKNNGDLFCTKMSEIRAELKKLHICSSRITAGFYSMFIIDSNGLLLLLAGPKLLYPDCRLTLSVVEGITQVSNIYYRRGSCIVVNPDGFWTLNKDEFAVDKNIALEPETVTLLQSISNLKSVRK